MCLFRRECRGRKEEDPRAAVAIVPRRRFDADVHAGGRELAIRGGGANAAKRRPLATSMLERLAVARRMLMGRRYLMRTIFLYGGIFLLAGLSLLTSQMIVEHIPSPGPQLDQAVELRGEMRSAEGTTDRITLLIVVPLLVVACIQLWRNPL
jgi:hypothetical protein